MDGEETLDNDRATAMDQLPSGVVEVGRPGKERVGDGHPLNQDIRTGVQNFVHFDPTREPPTGVTLLHYIIIIVR